MRIFKFGISVVAAIALFGCAVEGEGSEFDQPNPGDVFDADSVAAEASSDTAETASEEASSDDLELQFGTLEQALGGSCGSESGILNQVVTRVAVPDHFPPDSVLAQAAAVAIGIPLAGFACALFGVANLSPTCDIHDACYASFGASKSACDRAARSGWERACKRTYDNIDAGDVALGFLTGGLSLGVTGTEQACRTTCLGMVDVMFAAISSGGQGAFDVAQQDASRPTADALPEGPIFF